MKKLVVVAGLSAASVALASCQSVSYQPEPLPPQREQTRSIEGNWVDSNGIVSSFRDGTFETRTTDSNSVLATGQYDYVSDSTVRINLHSRLRNTDSVVDCAMINPSQLNCTSNTGTQFSLARSGGGYAAY